MFGGIGAVLSDSVQHFCVPLIFTIQDGLREMASWSEECSDFALSHVVQTIRNGYEAARTLGRSYLVLDRYFLTVPLLTELNRLNASDHILDVVTRAKNSCVAYDPPEPSPSKRGSWVVSSIISGRSQCQSFTDTGKKQLHPSSAR